VVEHGKHLFFFFSFFASFPPRTIPCSLSFVLSLRDVAGLPFVRTLPSFCFSFSFLSPRRWYGFLPLSYTKREVLIYPQTPPKRISRSFPLFGGAKASHPPVSLSDRNRSALSFSRCRRGRPPTRATPPSVRDYPGSAFSFSFRLLWVRTVFPFFPSPRSGKGLTPSLRLFSSPQLRTRVRMYFFFF